MKPGMMPILHLPGEMIPGQFGPISRVVEFFSAAATRTMSSTGMPSVMQMTSGSAASEGFEDGVRRKRRRNEAIAAVRACVLRAASATVLKIGTPRCFVPPLPGVTPATIFVP